MANACIRKSERAPQALKGEARHLDISALSLGQVVEGVSIVARQRRNLHRSFSKGEPIVFGITCLMHFDRIDPHLCEVLFESIACFPGLRVQVLFLAQELQDPFRLCAKGRPVAATTIAVDVGCDEQAPCAMHLFH